jgi:hypothetical protein
MAISRTHKTYTCKRSEPVYLNTGLQFGPEIQTKRQDTQHDCLPSLLDVGDKGFEIVYGEEKIFCTGSTRAAKAEQKSAGTTSPTNKPKIGRFHLYSMSPHSPQFQQSAGATLLYSLWFCLYSSIMRSGPYVVSHVQCTLLYNPMCLPLIIHDFVKVRNMCVMTLRGVY